MDGKLIGVLTEANFKKERMAAKRALRVRALLPRSCSKCSRKLKTNGASTQWNPPQRRDGGVSLKD